MGLFPSVQQRDRGQSVKFLVTEGDDGVTHRLNVLLAAKISRISKPEGRARQGTVELDDTLDLLGGIVVVAQRRHQLRQHRRRARELHREVADLVNRFGLAGIHVNEGVRG